MAGVKGKSGGPRKNAGGTRPGAGRKPKKPADGGERDVLELLQDIALGKIEATTAQVRAAIAAVQYTHTKTHDGGKKEAKDAAAKKAASKFSPAPPPLRVVGGTKK